MTPISPPLCPGDVSRCHATQCYQWPAPPCHQWSLRAPDAPWPRSPAPGVTPSIVTWRLTPAPAPGGSETEEREEARLWSPAHRPPGSGWGQLRLRLTPHLYLGDQSRGRAGTGSALYTPCLALGVTPRTPTARATVHCDHASPSVTSNLCCGDGEVNTKQDLKVSS